MKSRRWAILILALGPFGASAAVGQAPGVSGSRADESHNDLRSMVAEPVGAQLGHADLEPRREAPTIPVPRPQSSNANPLLAIPLESLRMTRERPLFSVSRRPSLPIAPAPPKAADPTSAEPTAPEKPQITLLGVVHGADVDIGVFVDDTDKSLIRLRVGQAIRGWIVHDIDLRAATLEKADQQVKLELPARSTEMVASTPPRTVALAYRTPVGRFKRFATANRL
jgi:general secretion pathway protein N